MVRVFDVADLVIDIPQSVNQATLSPELQRASVPNLALFGQATFAGRVRGDRRARAAAGSAALGASGGRRSLGAGGARGGGALAAGSGRPGRRRARGQGGQGNKLGVGGGVAGFGGGQLGQFGNLGGQFGIQGNDPRRTCSASSPTSSPAASGPTSTSQFRGQHQPGGTATGGDQPRSSQRTS